YALLSSPLSSSPLLSSPLLSSARLWRQQEMSSSPLRLGNSSNPSPVSAPTTLLSAACGKCSTSLPLCPFYSPAFSQALSAFCLSFSLSLSLPLSLCLSFFPLSLCAILL